MTIIQTKGTQFLSVPNTISGREFIAHLRGYLNRKEWKLTALRGRATNRRKKGGNGQDTPTRTADWLAVYIERKPDKALCARQANAWSSGYVVGTANGKRTALDFLKNQRTLTAEALETLRESVELLEDLLQPPPAPSAGEGLEGLDWSVVAPSLEALLKGDA